jgi:hypothetical protein
MVVTDPSPCESEPVVSLLCQGDRRHTRIALCSKNEMKQLFTRRTDLCLDKYSVGCLTIF